MGQVYWWGQEGRESKSGVSVEENKWGVIALTHLLSTRHKCTWKSPRRKCRALLESPQGKGVEGWGFLSYGLASDTGRVVRLFCWFALAESIWETWLSPSAIARYNVSSTEVPLPETLTVQCYLSWSGKWLMGEIWRNLPTISTPPPLPITLLRQKQMHTHIQVKGSLTA